MSSNIEDIVGFNGANIASDQNSNVFCTDRFNAAGGWSAVFGWNVSGSITGSLRLRGGNNVAQGFVAGLIGYWAPSAGEVWSPLPASVTADTTAAASGILLTAVAAPGVIVIASTRPLPKYCRWEWDQTAGAGGAPNSFWLDMYVKGLL